MHTLPRPSGDRSEDEFFSYRTAELGGQYLHEGRRVPVVWLADRSERGGQVELLASGARAVPSEAETSEVPERGLWERLARHSFWMPVLARPSPLHTGGTTPDESESGGRGDQNHRAGATPPGRWGLERALARFSAPCSVMVTAEPVTRDLVDTCVQALDQRAIMAGGRQAARPQAQEAFRHWSGRVWEMRRALAQGAWLLRVVVGTDDEAAARDLAGRVAAAYGPEVAPLGYLLVPGSGVAGFEEAMRAAIEGEYATDHEWHWDLPDPAAGIVSSRLVAALIRPPRVELPGIRLFDPPAFDIATEHTHGPLGDSGTEQRRGVVEQELVDEPDPEVPDDGTGDVLPELRIPLGMVLDTDREPVEEFVLSGSSLNRHLFVPGATGSGKTTTVRSLLSAAARLVYAGVHDGKDRPARRLPWMVVEPEKAEYAEAMARELARMGERLVVIRPGDLTRMRAGIDPMRPAPGFGLQTHVDLVRALFLAAFDAAEPFPQVLSLALTRCYEAEGWDLATGQWHNLDAEPRYPTLADLQRTAEQVIREIGYGQEVADNILGFVRVRLSSLRLGTTGQFLEDVHQIDFAELLRRFVVIELEDVGDDSHKAFLMGAVLIGLVEHLRVQAQSDREWSNAGLRHLTVFEEAHRLLRRQDNDGTGGSGASGHAVRMITGLLAEIRAYGEGLVIADQIPSQLDPAVIKNTAVKIMHRLPAQDDRDAVGATMNLSKDQSEYVVTLPPGQAAAFADGMDRPVLIGLPRPKRRTSTELPIDGPDAVTEHASGRCRVDYGLNARSAGTIAAARRLRETEPGLTLWAELAVVAHLVGHHVPRPSTQLRTCLAQLDPSEADTALVQAVDAAVADRSRHVWRRASPPELAQHVLVQLRSMRDGGNLDGAETAAERQQNRLQWIAPSFTWSVARRLLSASHRATPTAGRHPHSDLLASLIGQDIGGATLADQLAFVQNRRAGEPGQLSRERAKTIFAGTPPPLDLLVPGRDTDNHQWEQRLVDLTGHWLERQSMRGVVRVVSRHGRHAGEPR